MARLLITGAGGPAGDSLGRQLQGTPHAVVGVDMEPLSLDAEARFDRTYVVPAATSPDFLPRLRDLVRREAIDVVIPTVQEELPILAGVADLVGARVVISPSEAVWRAQDKLITAWALEQSGVPTPRTCALVSSSEGEDHAVPSPPMAFPFIVKPRTSRGGRGVTVVDSAAEWTREVLERPGQVVQEFADGAEYAVQVYVPSGGDDVTSVVLEKTTLKQGRVGNAEAVRRVSPEEDADVAAVATDAVLALGLRGPLDVDVRRDGWGAPVVLEVNARFGANSAYAPELLARLLEEWNMTGADPGST